MKAEIKRFHKRRSGYFFAGIKKPATWAGFKYSGWCPEAWHQSAAGSRRPSAAPLNLTTEYQECLIRLSKYDRQKKAPIISRLFKNSGWCPNWADAGIETVARRNCSPHPWGSAYGLLRNQNHSRRFCRTAVILIRLLGK